MTGAERTSEQPQGVGWPWVVGIQLVVMLLFAVVSAATVRTGCVEPGPPVDLPVPGTPRAGYCSAVDGGTPWFQFVGAPMVILALVLVALRRRPGLGWLLTGLACVAVVANSAYMHSLEFNVTI